LVFTEPHVDIGRNGVLPANEKDALEHANDLDMMHAMGEAKWKFMTQAEALIHGDLHTGSVMVMAKSGDQGESIAKAFDSEFAFFGPVGFDLGALWANYTLNASRAIALGDEAHAKWVLSLVDNTWNSFEQTFRDRYQDRVDPRIWNERTLEDRLAQWKKDTWLFASAKMSRRIVGLAKVADVEKLEPNLREGAARGILNLSRTLAKRHNETNSTSEFIETAGNVLNQYKTS
jgi:5-methylthioribose kinase